MGKFYLNSLSKEDRIRLIGEFYDAVSSLKSREEVRLLFKDLLSADEIAMLIRRIEVALLLFAGYGYREISEALRVSVDKVANVQKSIRKSGEGYQLVIKRLRKIAKTREQHKQRIEKKSRAVFPDAQYIRNKYPQYCFISNLLDELDEWLRDDGKIQIERIADMVIERRKRKRR